MTPEADLVIRGAHVVCCDDAWTTHPRGGVAVRGSELIAVGDDDALEQHCGPGTVRLEANGDLLIPGLINMHCHAGDVLFRGLVENLPLEAWLDRVWTAERATLTEETTELGAALGFAENALAGVTTVVDMFWHTEANLRGARSIGTRIATGQILFDLDGMDSVPTEQRAVLAEEFLRAHARDGDLFPCVMPHSAYTVGPEGLRRADEIARRHGVLLSLHAAETRAEQRTIEQRHGRRVIEHLTALGVLGEHTILAHCVHLDQREIELLARSGATVVHNPASNLKLGSGIAPVPDLLDAGVRVTLGTDGAISGNDTDLWLALRLVALLHKGVREDPTAITARQALAMATRDAARALGAHDRIGSLEVGKQADFVLLRTDRAHAVPCFDPHTHLVYSTNKSDVRHVYVRGEPIVWEGTLAQRPLQPILDAVRALQPSVRATLPEGLDGSGNPEDRSARDDS